MQKTRKPLKTILIILLIIILIFIAVAIGYVAYVYASYHRVEDNQELKIYHASTLVNDIDEATEYNKVNTSKEHKAISYNIGFSAYVHNFSFFMDGGRESWAKSKESVIDTTNKITKFLKEQNADFYSLQEVDSKGTRTYNVNEVQMIQDGMNEYNTYAVCFDSPFLFWPIAHPHGANTSNIMTISRYLPHAALRRSLPIAEDLTKIVDYDRCYSLARYKCDNDKELIIYTTHMSAYAKDEEIANNQIKMLVQDMQSEYDKGNYVICGSDFNRQIVDNPQSYFKLDRIQETPIFPKQCLDGTNIKLVVPFDMGNPVGSCRHAGVEYSSDVPICNIDGFLASDNIEVTASDVIDTKFEYSDHNPVYMSFKFK
ncbi:MAG: hypothetical protein MJ189_01890 [Coriobacteriales bacterium]|nr:hypothetical protein [Coriobacteriales bacterium]